MCRKSATVCLIKSPTRQHRAITDLPARLATLPDPRDRRGRRHPFVSVRLVACSAVLCGARSFAAIGHWARTNVPRRTPWPGPAPVPCRVRRARRAERVDDPPDHQPVLSRWPR
ncbi:transposase family protein [Streptomyces sp. NPDC007355]|uniref:transposase family protein n=1 Tax=Streptomyces sp. NPDC007355 TaxID=3364778 RepID=UPI00369ADCC2